MDCYGTYMEPVDEDDNHICVILAIMNSFSQIILYTPLQILYWYVISHEHPNVSNFETYKEIAKSIVVFLGIPLGTRDVLELKKYPGEVLQ